jgi:small subunit ribosomal protein S21
MLIVNVKENETIDRALKRYKKKFEKTGTMRQLRARTAFEKPSVKRRTEMIRAAYKEKMYGNHTMQ